MEDKEQLLLDRTADINRNPPGRRFVETFDHISEIGLRPAVYH